jgi:hypothetical protein
LQPPPLPPLRLLAGTMRPSSPPSAAPLPTQRSPSWLPCPIPTCSSLRRRFWTSLILRAQTSGKWLTAEAVNQLTAVSPADKKAVRTFLGNHGAKCVESLHAFTCTAAVALSAAVPTIRSVPAVPALPASGDAVVTCLDDDAIAALMPCYEAPQSCDCHRSRLRQDAGVAGFLVSCQTSCHRGCFKSC